MYRFLIAMCALFLLAGCGGGPDQDAVAEANRAGGAAASHDHDHDHDHGPGGIVHGAVAETMDAGGYTYVRVTTADGDIWAAGPLAEVSVGDQVDISTQMVMADFHSEALDRTFERIFFVNGFGGAMADPEQHVRDQVSGAHADLPSDGAVDVSGVAPAEGGLTIAAMYAEGPSMQGAKVLVRGKVVKVNMGIMGTNWYHIQDGSAEGDHGDLTITSDARLNVGDTVLVEGVGTVDKDFGAGYRYDLIVENAQVTVESM